MKVFKPNIVKILPAVKGCLIKLVIKFMLDNIEKHVQQGSYV